MVHDELWRQIHGLASRRILLCGSCMSLRLRRLLTDADLKAVPINDMDREFHETHGIPRPGFSGWRAWLRGEE